MSEDTAGEPVRITGVVNVFGPPVTRESLDKITKGDKDPQAEFNLMLLEKFFDLKLPSLSKEMLDRYLECSAPELAIPFTPLIERIVPPLKSAKRNYCFGEYISTIALCGMIGEMLAILLWRATPMTIGGKVMDEREQQDMFGNYTFEDLGQERRVRVLYTLKAIDDNKKAKFDCLRNCRKKFLHKWDVDLTKEKSEALECLKTCYLLFKEIFGLQIINSQIAVNPLILKVIQDGRA